MAASPWILISIIIILVILLVLAIVAFKSRTKKAPIDYHSWFIMGIIWTAIGIPLKNTVLSILGVVFMIASLVHKNEWKKNRKANQWKNLSGREQKIKLWLLTILGVLVLVGIIIFFFVAKGRV